MSAAVQPDTAPSVAQQLAANTMADLVRLIAHHEEQRAVKAAAARVMHDFAQGLVRFDCRAAFDATALRLQVAEVSAMGRRVVVEEAMNFPPDAVPAAVGPRGAH